MQNFGEKKSRTILEGGRLFYKTLFDQSRELKLITNARGVILAANDMAVTQLNSKKDELIGSSVRDHFGRKLAGELHRAIRYVARGIRPLIKELEWPLADESRWLRVTLSAVKINHDSAIAVMISAVDITHLKNVEKDVRSHGNRLKKIIDNLDLGILLINSKHRILEMNRKFQERNPNVEIDSTCHLAIEHCRYAQQAFKRCPGTEVVNTGKPISTSLRIQSTNGERKDIKFDCLPVLNGNRNAPDILEITEDVTDQRAVEEKLKDALERSEVYVDLIGHDMANFLTPLYVYVDFLIRDKAFNRRTASLLGRMLDQMGKMSSLIRNVRILSEIDRSGYSPVKTDLRNVVADAIKMAGVQYPLKKVRANKSFPEGECPIVADRYLVNAFSNIIQNAIEASEGSEIPLDLSISIRKRSGKKRYLVSISDYGPGIDDVRKELLLSNGMTSVNSHFMGLSTRTGRGLGLRVAKKITELSGGKFRIEDRVRSAYSKGASMVFDFPAPS